MIIRRTNLLVILIVGIFTCLGAFAQESAPTAEPSGAVPPLVNFASTLSDINSKPIVGVTGVTFLLYKPHGEAEQPRVLLLSVPYPLKAGDAATVGGLPAPAFMLANSGAAASKPPTRFPPPPRLLRPARLQRQPIRRSPARARSTLSPCGTAPAILSTQ